MITGKALDREKVFEEQKDIKPFMGIFISGKIFRQMFTLQNTFKSGKLKTLQIETKCKSWFIGTFQTLQTCQTPQTFQTFQTSQTFQTLQPLQVYGCYPAKQVMWVADRFNVLLQLLVILSVVVKHRS